MLADIGGGTTDIAVFRDNSICHTSVLPIAGYQFTRDISLGLGIPYDLAEEIKRKYGDVTPEAGDGKQDEEIKNIDGHVISCRDLSEIIRLRAEELLRLIKMEVSRNDSSDIIPSGIVLTGGSSNLAGFAEFAGDVTRIPVRIGTPVQLYGVADRLLDPAYATAVGLILWNSRSRDTQKWETRSGLRRLMDKIFKLFR